MGFQKGNFILNSVYVTEFRRFLFNFFVDLILMKFLLFINMHVYLYYFVY